MAYARERARESEGERGRAREALRESEREIEASPVKPKAARSGVCRCRWVKESGAQRCAPPLGPWRARWVASVVGACVQARRHRVE
eukprot:5527662-Prymnesium_polylepis.1